tara:strand:+ start:49 stop:966 length:918 start_codon:yes stop_codon:yes gene_type:complete
MNIFEDHKQGRSRRSPSLCSYCRKEGHNRNDCPHALEDWEQGWKDLKVPLTTTNVACSWFKNPRYWGEWYKKCKELVELQQHRKANPKSKPAKRTMKDLTCGFCGTKGHTRRNCLPKSKFLQDAHLANANWRQEAYNYLVVEKGIATGAIVKLRVKEGSNYYSQTWSDAIGTIVGINWDSLSFTASKEMYKGWDNEDLRSGLRIKVLVNGEIKTLGQKKESSYHNNSPEGKSIVDGDIFAERSLIEQYGSPIFNGVLSRAKTEPKPSDIFTENYKEAFDFIAKKRSHIKLGELYMVEAVDKWKTK